MHLLTTIRQDWLSNIRNDILAGTVVALALIPEAIAFSIIAGVDPKVGLYASFCIAIIIAFVGGRPGMISAATGAMALVMVTLVKEHGIEYLLAATVLTGIFQICAGILKLGSLLRFVSRSVTTGFVNALAILIFMAQLPELIGAGWQMYVMVAAGLVIIYGLPRITRVVPSPLVCIIVLTTFAITMNMDVLRTVGDMGELPDTLPLFLLPNVPLTLETFYIIAPYALTLCVVGLLESLMTAVIVDDLTDTDSNKNRECVGQGVANFITGFFGGMAGCAMIGQSVINVKSGGRGRLSTLWAGCFLFILILVLGNWVRQIPMAALVAVMIMVSIGTFNWSSIKNLRTYPMTTNIVMLATVGVVVITHDLAKGVFVGVLLSAIFFARKVSRFMVVKKETHTSNHQYYEVVGQVFFASATSFQASFDFDEAVENVTIDVSKAHFWDLSAVGALEKVLLKFRREGTSVHVLGMNEASRTIVDQLGQGNIPSRTSTEH